MPYSFSMQDASILLWLLLPVAVACGWLAAKADQKRRGINSSRDLPSAYFMGLNFLLNQQPDEAIEVFIKVLEADTATVETHLALGNLFRRRGEVERAIRMHQSLISRPTLDKFQRSQALLELGQDYLKAGLLDRAENLFQELVQIRLQTDAALHFLVQIYQQEKEWHKAIVASRKLARTSGKSQGAVIAQFYCELAGQLIAGRDFTSARRHLAHALTYHPPCVRASLLLGQLESLDGKDREAIKAWKCIEAQDPHYLGEVANDIAASYKRLNDESGLYEYFSGVLQRHGDVVVMLAMADIIRHREGLEAAENFVAMWLRIQPSVHGLYRLIELNLSTADSAHRSDLALLHGIIERLVAQQRGYVCLQCGFRGSSLHWQCPGCQRWNSLKPVTHTMETTEENMHHA